MLTISNIRKRWSDLRVKYGIDFTLGALSAIQGVMGVMSEPPTPDDAISEECRKKHSPCYSEGPQTSVTYKDEMPSRAAAAAATSSPPSTSSSSPSASLSPPSSAKKGPFVICSGVCGRRDVPKELFALDDGQVSESYLHIDDGQAHQRFLIHSCPSLLSNHTYAVSLGNHCHGWIEHCHGSSFEPSF